ncbi:exodeoxyribonuclease I [Pelistega indica]|uniref:Nuclease SbcCD subunit D n=1 Tax=Pelistega indica TaxID=1414851 RepID=V8FYL9_9BURK|nr:exonuclease SbcCD subunit D C-terminal domain-containing protein [Pelistega indica]ETD68808.1 exodeoxyribonuclease I [Pelistega indica]
MKPQHTLRLLHTSDWHLGATLYGRKRDEEFSQFLDWLLNTIHQQQADILIIAGDIFDTVAPSNTAQAIYYRFLTQLQHSPCRHIIIVGGNHDSASFLNAPKTLLATLNIHVVGAITHDLNDELIVLRNGHTVEAIICAVPYLRDKDIRTATVGESSEDKINLLTRNIKQHYHDLANLALQKREQFLLEQKESIIPIIGTGHLFAAGGQTIEGDGVRDIYIGNLGGVSSETFPSSLDYVALGHLHIPQIVNKNPIIRYSGSPIPMGFGEATQQKIIIQIDFHTKASKPDTPLAHPMSLHHSVHEHQPSLILDDVATPELTSPIQSISTLPIPCFQALRRLKGNLAEITQQINDLKNEKIWLEIDYNGEEIISDLREQLSRLVEGSHLEILRIKNNRLVEQTLSPTHHQETLDDLTPLQVFERCLEAHHVTHEQCEELIHAYQEIMQSLVTEQHQSQN